MSEITDGPYPGSRAFQQADRDRFFGRTKEASHVAGLWRTNRLTVLSGLVASGKTSLLRAGVYPRIADSGLDPLPPGSLVYDQTFPSAALPEHNAYTFSLLRSWSPDEMPTRLGVQTVNDFIRRHTQRHEGPVFAAIDHFEVLFAESVVGLRTSWRRQFLDELAEVVRGEPRLHLLLVTRNEALDSISSQIGTGARHMLGPLTTDAAIQAVARPAATSGRPFTDDAVDRLITDLRVSRVRPLRGKDRCDLIEPALLQVACVWLWRKLPPGSRAITTRDVSYLGDVDMALAEHWGQAIAEVADEHGLAARLLRTWLLDSFVTQSDACRPVDEVAVSTSGMPGAVARALVGRHLLTTGLRSTLRWYELLTDRLIEPLRRTTDKRPPAPTAARYLLAARYATSAGDLGAAQQHAEQALDAGPSLRLQAETESLMGNLAFERDQHDKAATHYRDAAGLFQASGDTIATAQQMAAVGRMLLAQGKPAEAVAELRAAIDRAPHDLTAQTELAVALWAMGESRAALVVLTGVLAIDGANSDALGTRGEILADIGNGRDAILDLDRQTIPNRPSIIAARGLALAELGDYPAAKREIDDALKIAPQNGLVLLYAARTSALAGDAFDSEKLATRAVDAEDPPLSPRHRAVAKRMTRHE